MPADDLVGQEGSACCAHPKFGTRGAGLVLLVLLRVLLPRHLLGSHLGHAAAVGSSHLGM